MDTVLLNFKNIKNIFDHLKNSEIIINNLFNNNNNNNNNCNNNLDNEEVNNTTNIFSDHPNTDNPDNKIIISERNPLNDILKEEILVVDDINITIPHTESSSFEIKFNSTSSTVSYFVGIAEFLTNIDDENGISLNLPLLKSVDVKMIRYGFSPGDLFDNTNTEIITHNNGRGVIIDEWEKDEEDENNME
ncbi:hypothetical protein H8356DRAFT_1434643 [Neocallimastix lanati (nom. inval.)]|nr:hypothetical protein H8356DRAFT_1434643 [Neocallimastix sp. JGI-2020a]